MAQALFASVVEAGISDAAGLSGQPGAFAHYRWSLVGIMAKALFASVVEAGISDAAGLNGQPGAFAHYRW